MDSSTDVWVWTGMESNYTNDLDCEGWENGTGGSSGRSGKANSVSEFINANSIATCGTTYHIYCVEQ